MRLRNEAPPRLEAAASYFRTAASMNRFGWASVAIDAVVIAGGAAFGHVTVRLGRLFGVTYGQHRPLARAPVTESGRPVEARRDGVGGGGGGGGDG